MSGPTTTELSIPQPRKGMKPGEPTTVWMRTEATGLSARIPVQRGPRVCGPVDTKVHPRDREHAVGWLGTGEGLGGHWWTPGSFLG